MRIIIHMNRASKRAFRRRLRKRRDAQERQRYLIVLRLADGWSSVAIAQALSCARATVSRVARRYQREGEPGLWDHRRANGRRKITPVLRARLRQLVGQTPLAFGWTRPTWTQELLLRQLVKESGVDLGRTSLARLLREIGARRGRPRPIVRCPWPEARRQARLRYLRRLARYPPPGSVVFYQDEVEVHLNPKIGYDWMLPGQQKQVLTPGQNVKRHLAGALHAQTGELVWVAGERKTTALFLALLQRLLAQYPHVTIHLILDNYCIHTSAQARRFLAPLRRRIRLHFLPPYCPNDNRIERVWQDLHANVTRNHGHRTITDLLTAVEAYLHQRNADGAALQEKVNRAA